MDSMIKQVVTCLIVLAISGSALAQGSLHGVISDQYSGEPLIGASIMVMGTSYGASTNIDGEYRLNRVPSGSIQVRFSYVGFETQIIDVEISDGERVELNVEMRVASVDFEEIRISAQAMGQVAAMNQQKADHRIINLVSEERIRELPDANAAESIGRLSGVSVMRSGGEANKVMLRGLSDKYLSVTVDGIRMPTTDALARGIDLSTISQSSLAGIELYKSLTPDQDADAIAGSINMTTRRAPMDREIRITSKGGYNGLMQSVDQYDFSGNYGERFFANLIGVQVNANIERKIRSNERSRINYSEKGPELNDYYISALNLDFTNEMRSRMGLGGVFDINTPDGGNIRLNTMYSTTERDFLTHSRNYPRGGSVFYTYRDQEQEIKMFTNSLIGENYLLDMDVNWGVSYSRSEAEYPHDYELSFVEGGGMGNPPEIRRNPEQFVDFAYNNFSSASIYEGYVRTQDNSHGELSAYVDLIKQYALSDNISGELKGGIKYRYQNRTNENSGFIAHYHLGSWRPYLLEEDGSVVSKDYTGTYFESFYNTYLENPSRTQISFIHFLHDDPQSRMVMDEFDLNPLISSNRIRQWYDLNRQGVNSNGSTMQYRKDVTTEANTYDITETVSAGYLMNTFSFGERMVMIMGARVEQENHDYENRYSPRQIGGFPVPEGVTRDTTSTYKETAILPHLHLNYQATDFMSIRAAAYRALARPDYNMRLLSFFAWRASETGGDRILVLGNPNLKTAKAWNFELSTAFFGNRIGLFTVSAFYKHIDDMYHMLNGLPTRGDLMIQELGMDWSSPHAANATYNLFVPYNSPNSSYVRGLEVDHQINFTWLPGIWRNFLLNYNVSYVNSETSLIGTETITEYIDDPILGERPVTRQEPIEYTQAMENQPELFGNVALGYDTGGFSGRVSLFHQTEFYSAFSPRRRNDPLVGAFTKLDLAFTYKFTDNITMTANVNNLTDLIEDDFRHNRQAPYIIPTTGERYGSSFDLGVRIDL